VLVRARAVAEPDRVVLHRVRVLLEDLVHRQR
jgi:hypothetical protein